eukprot:COSAG02_NODE_3509_length_6634_cov_2.750574_6_plen_69_part_00
MLRACDAQCCRRHGHGVVVPEPCAQIALVEAHRDCNDWGFDDARPVQRWLVIGSVVPECARALDDLDH